MLPQKQLPASLRYFRAQLRTLARPSVLASGIVLCLVVVGIWEYWTHPEWLSAAGNNPQISNDRVADSDNTGTDNILFGPNIPPSIADIENSQVLKKELNTPIIPPVDTPFLQNSDNSQSQGLYDRLTHQQSPTGTQTNHSGVSETSTDKTYASTPIAPSIPNLLPNSSTSGSFLGVPISQPSFPSTTTASPSSVTGSNLFNPININPSIAPVSPLQTALSQISPNNSTLPSVVAQTPPLVPSPSLPTTLNQGQIAPPPTQPYPSTYNLPSTQPYPSTYNLPSTQNFASPAAQPSANGYGTSPTTSTTAYPNAYSINPYNYSNRPQSLPTNPPVAPTTATTLQTPNNLSQPSYQNPNPATRFNNPPVNYAPGYPGIFPSQRK